MIVVADTTPVNHLILIGEISVLEVLFGKIIIPNAVFSELLADGAPTVVREFISSSPSWIEVHQVDYQFDGELDSLDVGERDAIVLAEELNADYLLIDEKLGRRVAAMRNIRIVGTLGILDQAAEEGLLDFQTALTNLQANDFFVSDELAAFFLGRDEERKRMS